MKETELEQRPHVKLWRGAHTPPPMSETIKLPMPPKEAWLGKTIHVQKSEISLNAGVTRDTSVLICG